MIIQIYTLLIMFGCFNDNRKNKPELYIPLKGLLYTLKYNGVDVNFWTLVAGATSLIKYCMGAHC